LARLSDIVSGKRNVRLSSELRQTVDKWAEKQDDKPGRSEAIRRLVEIGLKKEK